MIGLGLILGRLARGIADFFADNWRRLLPVIGLLILTWYINHLQVQRDDAREQLASLQQDIEDAHKARKAEIARKDVENTIAQGTLKANHLAQLEQLRRHYDARNQNDKAAAGRTIDQWRERVRLELAARYAGGGGEVSAPSGGITESRGDGNAIAAGAYVDALETACAITTADYNALWESWDKACKVYGCK